MVALGCGADGPPIVHPRATTTLVVHVTDGPSGRALPAKLLLYADGTPLTIGALDMYNGTVQDRGYCELSDGAIGTWQGIALARGDAELPVGVPVCDAAVPI